MAKTPKLGTSDSILGVSQVLGSASEGSLAENVPQSLGFGQVAGFSLTGPIRVSNFTVQVLWNQGAISAEAENTLSLAQEIFPFLAIGDRTIVEQTLDFVQAADFGEKRGNNELNLVQSVSFIGPREEDGQNNLGLQQGAKFCLGRWGANEITDNLGLTQAVGFGRPVAASNTLALIQEAARIFPVSQTLSLGQSVSAGRNTSVQQSLGLTQQVADDANYLRSLSQGPLIKQACTYFINSSCNRKRYARFDGEGEGSPLPPKRLAFKSDFVLQSSTETLRLRSPEPDDRDRVGFNRINRETRGGELNVFADASWPRVNTLLFTIVALKTEKIEALQDFLQNTIGQEIKIHDWTGTSWLGVITTPDEAATEDRDGYWTISFEFEGEPFDGPYAENQVTLEQSVVVAGDWTRSVTQSDVVSQAFEWEGPKPHIGSNAMDMQQSASAMVV